MKLMTYLPPPLAFCADTGHATANTSLYLKLILLYSKFL